LPRWDVDDGIYERSAASFDNPDFVAVAIHSHRHRFGLAEGDPTDQESERRLAAAPPITVPTITLDGDADGVMRIGGSAGHTPHFTGRHEHRIVAGAGHNLPQEAPQAFAEAVLAARGWREGE
jgi:pimeloyl-ACP methyl ester carboxylesterase